MIAVLCCASFCIILSGVIGSAQAPLGCSEQPKGWTPNGI